MANYCSNSVTYYSDNPGHILNLYLRIKGAAAALGDMDKEYMAAKPLLAQLGVKPGELERLDGRTSIDYLGLVVEDGKPTAVQFDAESAWTPCDDFAEVLLRAIYPEGGDIEMVYTAEESGSEIYINTDVDHRFYKNVLVVDVRAGRVEDRFYFDVGELERAFELIEGFTGCRPGGLADFDDAEFMKKLNACFAKKYPDEDEYLSIYVYTNA